MKEKYILQTFNENGMTATRSFSMSSSAYNQQIKNIFIAAKRTKNSKKKCLRSKLIISCVLLNS